MVEADGSVFFCMKGEHQLAFVPISHNIKTTDLIGHGYSTVF